jgi:phosphoribosylformimino-5-aminoimidazole carboxamide ribotide isomerase
MSADRKSPRIIPVLDVMDGAVVRAVGGRRDEYRPVVSKLIDSTEPVEVAKALLGATGADALYVADLDAITGADRSGRAVTSLAEQCGCRLFADVGIRTKADFARVPRAKNVVPILGSETLVGTDAALQAGGYYLDEWAFSLDLFNGRLLGDWSAWTDFDVRSDVDVWEMAATAVWNCGAGTLIVIDLANVGTGAGPGTEYWCRKIRATLPEVNLIAGGGVRTWEDIDRLGEAGADSVLVASALHDGVLT